MSMTKIKATYRFCRGIGSCTLCPKYPEDPEVLYAYGGADDIEGAEKLLYEEMFDAERESQNERYRKKGNYGRIWTMDEWRRPVSHRRFFFFIHFLMLISSFVKRGKNVLAIFFCV